jgi:putative ABC transport system ATP-binding protein
MELFRSLNAAGTTIIQVTHSEQNAGYGNRVVRLADGWLVREPAATDARAARPGVSPAEAH